MYWKYRLVINAEKVFRAMEGQRSFNCWRLWFQVLCRVGFASRTLSFSITCKRVHQSPGYVLELDEPDIETLLNIDVCTQIYTVNKI